VSAWQQHDDPVYESECPAAARLDRDDPYGPRADPRRAGRDHTLVEKRHPC
jgi:hypothetical protein